MLLADGRFFVRVQPSTAARTVMQEGVRLDQKETLQALYDAYGWIGATLVLPREAESGADDAKTRINTGGPAWIRTRNQRLMRESEGRDADER